MRLARRHLGRRVALLMALAVAGACSGGDGVRSGLSVTMVNFAFRPMEVHISSGDVVTFSNNADTSHNFTLIGGGRVSFDVLPGQSVSTEKLGELAPGTYGFECRFHSGQGMVGFLDVTASSGT